MTRLQTTPRSFAVRSIVHVLIAVLLHTPIFGSLAATNAAAQNVQNTTRQFEYDAEGNLKKIVDPLARSTDLTYDGLRRLTRERQPGPTLDAARPTIGYTYDGLDYLSSVTDPRLLTTSYSVNGFGNLLSQVSPDTGTTTTAYRSTANTLYTSKDARAKTTTYTHDALGRVVSMTYGTGTATRFEYDGGAAPVAAASGRVTKMTDESGSTVYTYSDFGEVASKTQTVTASSKSLVHSVAYGYGTSGSATGKLSSVTYPSGNQVNYRYDATGRVNAITINPVNANGVGTNASVEYALLSNVEYAAHGPVKGWQWGNSTEANPNAYSRSYDLDGRITSYNLGNPLGTGSQRTLTWDAASRIRAYTHTGVGTNTAVLDQSFEYDDLDRLTRFTSSAATQAYSYDANGNRTSLSIGATAYTNTIAADSNRLLGTTGPVPAKTNTYDLAGNLTNDTSITFTYTARGRMSSATVGTAKTSYLYNGLGQRVRQVKGTTVNPTGLLMYDEAGHIIGEYNSSTGKASKEFIYLGDTPVGVLEQVITGAAPNEAYATNVYFVYTDHLDTPRFITRSPDGQTVWRWDNGDPFGLLPPNDNPAGLGIFTFNLRMPGQYYDKSTNLFYNYFRDYDPQLGRYLQSDPIGLEGGIDPYIYVNGDPLTGSDPSGLIQLGTIHCDGNGNYEIINHDQSPTRRCTQRHEEIHLEDWKRRYGPNSCKGPSGKNLPKGSLPTHQVNGVSYRDFARDSECRAYSASMECVKSCKAGSATLNGQRLMFEKNYCNKYNSWRQ